MDSVWLCSPRRFTATSTITHITVRLTRLVSYMYEHTKQAAGTVASCLVFTATSTIAHITVRLTRLVSYMYEHTKQAAGTVASCLVFTATSIPICMNTLNRLLGLLHRAWCSQLPLLSLTSL